MTNKILALKYRPQEFKDLIGQEVMAQTITNAIKLGKTPNAYLLTGIRGVGKTTTTANIGMSLARLGHSTLLLDADVGLRNLDLLLGLENRIIYTGVDVLNKVCRLEQAVIKDKRQSKLVFLPLSSNRSEVDVTSEQIKDLINIVQSDYEYILIDSPAGIDNSFQTAIECAKRS